MTETHCVITFVHVMSAKREREASIPQEVRDALVQRVRERKIASIQEAIDFLEGSPVNEKGQIILSEAQQLELLDKMQSILSLLTGLSKDEVKAETRRRVREKRENEEDLEDQ